MGLSLRQLLCSIVAIAATVALYFGLRNVLGQETVSWVCIAGAAPVAAAGFFEYDGMNFEKFLLAVWESEVLRAGPRVLRAGNRYQTAAKRRKEGKGHESE